MKYLICVLIGYLIGSFPGGFLIVKKVKEIDITQIGLGNIGAVNCYEITRSKTIAATVLAIDALKGLLSVAIPVFIFKGYFELPALSLIFAVISHCYNPWLRFKGGRGLATSAGGVILLFPFLLIVWSAIWIVIYLFKRDTVIANIFSIVISLIIVLLIGEVEYEYSFPHAGSMPELLLFAVTLLAILFIRHIDQLLRVIDKAHARKIVRLKK